jgi:hypothetical protein
MLYPNTIIRKEFPQYDRYVIFKNFLKHVVIGKLDECWEWQGAKLEGGYGQFRWDEAGNLAHVAAYLLFIGEIPKNKNNKKLQVCHSCDNPPCCNPNHLWSGTSRQNTRDMIKKGRGNFRKGGCPKGVTAGENNGNSKLTLEKVLVIKRLRKTGETLKDIAERFNVSLWTIWAIINKRAWKDA